MNDLYRVLGGDGEGGYQVGIGIESGYLLLH